LVEFSKKIMNKRTINLLDSFSKAGKNKMLKEE